MGIDYGDDDIDDIIVDNDDNDENYDDNGDQIMTMIMMIVVAGNCAIVRQWALPTMGIAHLPSKLPWALAPELLARQTQTV